MHRQTKASRWWAEVEINVPFHDVDSMQVVWHGNYAKYFEVARCELLNKINYNYVEMTESGFVWPVIDMQVRYIGAANFNQRLKIRADVVEWENRLTINYLISDVATGRRLTRASTTQVAVDMATGEMCFVSPPILFKKLGVEQ